MQGNKAEWLELKASSHHHCINILGALSVNASVGVVMIFTFIILHAHLVWCCLISVCCLMGHFLHTWMISDEAPWKHCHCFITGLFLFSFIALTCSWLKVLVNIFCASGHSWSYLFYVKQSVDIDLSKITGNRVNIDVILDWIQLFN